MALRRTRTTDASEAGTEVLEHQLIHQDPLGPAERDAGIPVDTESADWRIELSRQLRRIVG